MSDTRQVMVWDPLVRVFHWALVGAFATAYLSAEEWESVHVAAGYTVFGLLLFRLVWGLIGTRHARFSDFVQRPSQVMSYLKETLVRRERRYLGHNPAGGAMIVLMLASLLITTLSGIACYGVDEHAGPLAGAMVGVSEFWAEALEEVHEFFANFTVLLVFVHVAGVIVASLLHRENLARAMVTGYKRAEPAEGRITLNPLERV